MDFIVDRAGRARPAGVHSDGLSLDALAIVAHELRSPLAAIRNAIVILECAGSLPGAQDQARRLIARQVGRLSTVVEDLLDFARFRRGALTIHREWIDIAAVVEMAAETCQWALKAAGCNLSLRFPSHPVQACADANRLAQVVVNLLDNAAKHTGFFGSVELALEQGDHDVVLSVADDGAGISSDVLPHVFELFVQGNVPPRSRRNGLGIGLALVKHIVDLHGGTVEARSEGIGRGSQFVVRLPRNA